MSRHRVLLALSGIFILFSCDLPLAAQWRPSAFTRAAEPVWVAPIGPAAPVSHSRLLAVYAPAERARPAYGWMAVGGLLGGALGAGLGWAATHSSDDMGVAVLGGSLGAAAGIPLGVHLANGSRGNLLLAEGASLGVGAAVFFYEASRGGDAVPILVVAPAAELLVSVLIETATGR